MATQLVTFKIDDKALEEVDKTVKASSYQNRTEFIREALRKKIEEEKMKEAIEILSKMRGKAPKKISEKEYEKVRNETFDELYGSDDVFRRLKLANVRK